MRFARSFSALFAAGALIYAPQLLLGRETSIELPPESETYKKATGVELAQSFCVQCHSVEYTVIQPPLPAKFWDAEVKKMRDKYAAPIPPEMDAKLVDYLVKAYGVEK